MKKIYGLIEKNDNVVDNFWVQYDSDFEIHVYSPLIEICENSLFYCFRYMLSLFWEEENRSWIVTDVKEVYQLANKLCSSLFEKIVYIDHNVETSFAKKLDARELLFFDYKMIKDIKMRVVLQKFVNKISFFDAEIYNAFVSDIERFAEQWDDKLTAFFAHICSLLLYMDEEGSMCIYALYRLYLLAMLMKLEYLPEHTNAYLAEVLKIDGFKEENYYFVYNQFKRASFTGTVALDTASAEVLDGLYRESYRIYKENANGMLEKVPRYERHSNRVLVLTIQFLGIRHAPTKSILERCRAYRKLGKEVFLINTAEQGTFRGYVPFFFAEEGNVVEEYNSANVLNMGGGEEIWFRQLDNNLSIWDRFLLLAEYIKQIKPWYILTIGTGSILADLCSNMVPCASMAWVFSTLPMTINCMKILGRSLRQDELENDAMKDVIESRFTFELTPQKTSFTREQYQIPEDKFVLVVVGVRLDSEVTPRFCDMLEKVCRNDCYVVFAGLYDTYHKVKERYPLLAQNSAFIGYCNDMLALMEVCDLYVNPPRMGGGFSVIEAFAKGVPGVYLQSGDVYTAGGAEFSVSDFDEMEQTILRYKEDGDFYRVMSDKAIKRAELMTSSLEAMKELDRKIMKKVEKEFW